MFDWLTENFEWINSHLVHNPEFVMHAFAYTAIACAAVGGIATIQVARDRAREARRAKLVPPNPEMLVAAISRAALGVALAKMDREISQGCREVIQRYLRSDLIPADAKIADNREYLQMAELNLASAIAALETRVKALPR